MYIDSALLKNMSNIYVENVSMMCNDDADFAPHFTLAYAAHGSGTLIIDGSKYDINEGDVILIKPNTKNIFTAAADGPQFTMYRCFFMAQALPFEASNLEKEFPALKSFFSGIRVHLHAHDTPNNEIRDLFVRMIDDFTLTEPCSQYTLRARLTLALVNVFKLCSVTVDAKQNADVDVFSGIEINYIKKNIYKKITLNEVARFVHISHTYLCHLFKKHLNMTFVEFVNHLRVERIKDALEYTDRPINIICDDYDFSKKYLNMIFKKETGYSLVDYKNKFNYKSGNQLYGKLPDRPKPENDDSA